MSDSRAPRMSVVLVTDRYATIRKVVGCLRAQDVSDELELVIVAPSQEALDLDPAEVAGFGGVQVVEAGSIFPLAAARAAGVRAATAPVVQIGETHAFPGPGWAEALIRAHTRPWAAVVPAIRNANPGGPISWSNLVIDYGPWLEGNPPGEIDAMPTFNTAYKRADLLNLGDLLNGALGNLNDVLLELRAGGQRFYFEPSARIEHANISRPAAWLAQRYVVGRVRGAERGRSWSPLRRLIYACGAPLLPLVLYARARGTVQRLRRTCSLPPGTVPALLIGLTVMALGELVGYARGAAAGPTRRLDEYELHKLRATELFERSDA